MEVSFPLSSFRLARVFSFTFLCPSSLHSDSNAVKCEPRQQVVVRISRAVMCQPRLSPLDLHFATALLLVCRPEFKFLSKLNRYLMFVSFNRLRGELLSSSNAQGESPL